MSLENLCKLVEDGDADEAKVVTEQLLQDGLDPLEIIDALTKTMAHVGDLFAKLEIFLPEIMLSGEALTAAVDVLGPHLEASGGREIKGKVVLGVVKGDLHEIGKNIVKLILETNTLSSLGNNRSLANRKIYGRG